MDANIETVIVSQKLETITRKKVTCIYCGLPTPVPASGPSKFASHVPRHILSSVASCAARKLLTAPVTLSRSARCVAHEAFDPCLPLACHIRVDDRANASPDSDIATMSANNVRRTVSTHSGS